MKIIMELNEKLGRRLVACSQVRSVSPEVLAAAYVEDWLNIEYAELKGRKSRRGLYRDGPIAFDAEAAASADRIEADLRRIEGRN